jgi:hypothetical protein
MAIGAAGQYAQAATYNVNCNKNEHIGKALRVLAGANPHGPNTINVTGDCRGNFVIQSMDRLTLITKNGDGTPDAAFASISANQVVVLLNPKRQTTSTSVGSSVNPSFVNQGVTFTATVTSQSSSTLSGTATFTVDSTSVATVNVVNGQAKYSTTFALKATHQVSAKYSGDANHSGSTSAVVRGLAAKAAVSGSGRLAVCNAGR